MNAQNAGGLGILLINGRKDWENDMGVYIPNMDKPKDCIDCPIRFIDEIPCKPYQGLSPYDGYMDCPLIEIPTPHGRLIDADKVFCYDFMDEQNIDNAPTIIEAEE